MAVRKSPLEIMVNPDFWRGRRVLITGHTGFKGSWLSLWLQHLGAEVFGFALVPSTTPSLFEVAGVGHAMQSVIGDLRHPEVIEQAVQKIRPQIILHLAAQALVSEGYRDPIGTYSTNILGTAHLLEAARKIKDIQSIVVVTSDKCYENKEWPWPYREGEPLGGYDPYSSSKAGAELVAASYRQSFLADQGIPLATARAGNVFGGGDWSPNRLIPDLLQAFANRQPGQLRRPQSVRPWQHVLEPLAGYLLLAERLTSDTSVACPWNFGPADKDCLTTAEIANHLACAWGESASWETCRETFPHEAGLLRLDSSLARQKLSWHPTWPLEEALNKTVSWHKNWLSGADMRSVTIQQIIEYSTHAHSGQ